MKKILAALFLFGFMLPSTLVLATEPANLAEIKKQLKQYHDSGLYNKDIKNVDDAALVYLKHRVAQADFHGKKPAIVLDIDETSLSNYNDMVTLDFGGTLKEIISYEDKGHDPVIQPTLALYQFAKAHHVAVFFLTGRLEYERKTTAENLQKAGYHDWDSLILRDSIYKTAPASVYKTAIRKKLTEQGYDILLNVGDQNSDLKGGYADKTFKLPNPYYFIP